MVDYVAPEPGLKPVLYGICIMIMISPGDFAFVRKFGSQDEGLVGCHGSFVNNKNIQGVGSLQG
jgi:hypothetical protein